MGIATYLALNLAFIGVVSVLLGRVRAGRSRRQLVVALVYILLLTALFDSLLIASGIVEYDYSKLLGALVGFAPIEDFSYSIVAIVFVPLLWTVVGQKKGDPHVAND